MPARDRREPIAGPTRASGPVSAGILDLHVTIGGVARTPRPRGTYVITERAPGHWGIVHEHSSAPDPGPHRTGDWLPTT